MLGNDIPCLEKVLTIKLKQQIIYTYLISAFIEIYNWRDENSWIAYLNIRPVRSTGRLCLLWIRPQDLQTTTRQENVCNRKPCIM